MITKNRVNYKNGYLNKLNLFLYYYSLVDVFKVLLASLSK